MAINHTNCFCSKVDYNETFKEIIFKIQTIIIIIHSNHFFYLKLSLSLRLLQFFHTLICLNTTKGKECPKMAESSQQMQPNQAVKKGENMNNIMKNNTKYRMSLMDGIKILMCPRHFSSSFLWWTNRLYVHFSKFISLLLSMSFQKNTFLTEILNQKF